MPRVGYISPGSSQPIVNGVAIVQNLLKDLKRAAVSKDMARHQAISDQLEVFTKAYLVPATDVNWPTIRGPSQTMIAELLLAKFGKLVSRDSIMNALYFNKSDEAEPKTIDVLVCNIRRQLRGTGYRIEAAWGRGYRMLRCEPGKENDDLMFSGTGNRLATIA